MALPSRLARYQSLLDLLVEAALREMDGDAQTNAEAVDSTARSREPEGPAEQPTGSQRTATQ